MIEPFILNPLTQFIYQSPPRQHFGNVLRRSPAMHSLTSFATASLMASMALAVPLVSLTPEDIKFAGGGIPDVTPPPLKVTEKAIASYQSANYLENLQYAFFTEAI